MEELTKTQIVLLTLLVSFVTSIATGIVTVSLMDQAPATVTQTINRVVERTVDRVVPAETAVATQQVAAAIETKTREVVTVVKEENAVPEAIKRGVKGVVMLYQLKDTTGEGYERYFVGNGIVATKDGAIFVPFPLAKSGLYEVTFHDGKKIQMSVVESAENRYSILEPNKREVYTFYPIRAGDSNALVLGQSVIMIALKGEARVTSGIIESLIPSGTLSDSLTSISTGKYGKIVTSQKTDSAVAGAVLIDLSGSVVGLYRVSEEIAREGFIPASTYTDGLKKLGVL